MPYIIMKRNDIPDGILQVLDMEPNTSQRNYTLDPPGQTKYVNAAENQSVVTTGAGPIIMHRAANGLAGWLITNTNDGTGAAGVGTFTVAIATPIIPGDTVTVGPQLFTAVAGARTPGSNDFSLASGTDPGIATDLAAAINDPLNSGGVLPPLVTAVPAVAVVTITANMDGTAGNLALASSNGAGFSPVGMAGGVDAGAITGPDADTGAAAVLALYAFGDLTAAAGTLTLGDINGALVGGAAITAAQLPQVLNLLAGAKYEVPRGVQIEDGGGVWDIQPPVGTEGGPGFVPASNRALFLNDGLPLSFAMGELEEFRDSGFIYAGVAGDPNGEAVVVYNDDGTLFTP
jgi:hypothetical protein